MNTRHGIYAFLFLSALLSWQTKDTDAFGIIGKAIVIKAIIAAKIIKGAAALWIGRGGFGGFGGGAGGAGGAGGLGGTGGFLWGGRRRREVDGRRTQMTDEDIERVFSIILNMDEQFCMARIVCEIHATNDEKKFGELGVVIREIFKKYNSTIAHPHNAATIYKQAATVGSLTKTETCSEVYSTCNLEPDQINDVIDSANSIN